MYTSRSPFRSAKHRCCMESLEHRYLLTTVSVVANIDNSLFEDAQGNLSNGAGEYLFAGRTKQAEGRSLRRAMVQFELPSEIPPGATIDSVSLSLHMSKAISDDVSFSLHRLLEVWGEGASDARGQEGKGSDAAPGDSTWLHSVFPTEAWSQSGGTFVADPSASTDVGATNQQYTWSSEEMIADVESWLQNPSENFGWLVLGGELVDGTAKRFNSSEHEDASTRPTLTIDFSDPLQAPTVSLADASITEGDTDSNIGFVVTLSTSPTSNVTLNYATVDSTAVAGQDYIATSGEISFGPNDPLTQIVDVQIIGDRLTENDETFLLQLSQVDGAQLDDSDATGAILDDDPIPKVSISDVSTNEGTDENTIVQVPLELANPSSFEVSVDYQVTSGSAQADDFIASQGTVEFAPGETSKMIEVEIVGDAVEEADEAVSIELSNVTNAVIDASMALLTIVNDDVAHESLWQNPEHIWDVSGDGLVVPRDVLLIVNYINRNGSGPVPTLAANESPSRFYDVNGDDEITPRDVSLVINYINENGAGAPQTAGNVLAALLFLEDDDDNDE